jgi:hypothetical protein
VSDRQNESPAGQGGAGGTAPFGTQVRPHCTPTPQGRQALADPLAVHHLARLLAGAADADRDALRQAFPDIPLNGDDPDRSALRSPQGRDF